MLLLLQTSRIRVSYLGGEQKFVRAGVLIDCFFLGAPAGKPAAAAPPPSAAPPAAAPPPIVAAPAAPRPLTAVEQRGPRVYASPMAKRLAEAQQLRLEGIVLVLYKYYVH